MNKILHFINTNKTILLGMIVGAILAFVYWFNFAYHWGIYPLSSECWVNCAYGILLGGFISSLIENKDI